MTDKTLIELVDDYGWKFSAGRASRSKYSKERATEAESIFAEIRRRVGSRMRMEITLEDGTECEITVYGAEHDVSRLAARLQKLADDEARIAPPAVKQSLTTAAQDGEAVARPVMWRNKATHHGTNVRPFDPENYEALYLHPDPTVEALRADRDKYKREAEGHLMAVKLVAEVRDTYKTELAASQQRVRELEALRHAGNEWADMATNGIQWLRNIAEGIATADEALANMEDNLRHCKAVREAASATVQAASAERVAAPAIFGVARYAEDARCLLVACRTVPTDDEVRGVHELLRAAIAKQEGAE